MEYKSVSMKDNIKITGGDDLKDLCKHVLTKTSAKHVIFIFLLYVVITSHIFERYCLGLVVQTNDADNNAKQIILKKAITFTIMYIALNFLIESDML